MVGKLHHLGAFEDHIPVEIPAIRSGGVFIADEGGEAAGRIVTGGRVADLAPGLRDNRRGIEFRRQGVIAESGDHSGERLADRRRIRAEQTLSDRQLRQRAVRIASLADCADVLRVVGDGDEVQRPARQTNLVALGMADGLALGEPVGVVRRTADVEDVGVERKLGVDVQVAIVGVAVSTVARQAGWRLGRRGLGRRRRCAWRHGLGL